MSEMKVTLMAHTIPMLISSNSISDDVERFVASCAKGCYSEKSSAELMKEADEKYLKTLSHIIESGHGSVVEHLTFTFCVEGISRACANQLVRHRIASYSQQSQRYVKFDEVDMVMPPKIVTASENELMNGGGYDPDGCIYDLIRDYQINLKMLVDDLRRAGVPEEDIRYFYPIGMKTNITVTMNARALLNFFKWRCCKQAQWEIREMADKMLEICEYVAPTIFKNAGPECLRSGCKEGKRGCQKGKTTNAPNVSTPATSP